MGLTFLYTFVRFLLLALELMVFGRVLLSYIEPTGRSGIAQFLAAVTEPLLAPIRRLLPRTGAFDFSPIVVILVLGAIIRVLPG